MVALADNFARASKGPITYTRIPLNASTTVYNGTILMLDVERFGRPAAALAGNLGVVGICQEKVINSGADGAADVLVAQGVFEVPVTSTAQGEVGNIVYASTDNDTSDTQGTNEPIAGVIESAISSSKAWVRVGPGALTRALAT